MEIDWEIPFRRIQQAYLGMMVACLAAGALSLSVDRSVVYKEAINEVSYLDRYLNQGNANLRKVHENIAIEIYKFARPVLTGQEETSQVDFISEFDNNIILYEPIEELKEKPMGDLFSEIADLKSGGEYKICAPNLTELAEKLKDQGDRWTTTTGISCFSDSLQCHLYLVSGDYYGDVRTTCEMQSLKIPSDLSLFRDESPWRQFPNVSAWEVRYEIWNSTPKEAVDKLSQLVSSSEGRVSVFGVGVQGRVAFIVIPIVVTISAFFVFSGLFEVRTLSPTIDQIRSQFVPILFGGMPGIWLSIMTVLIIPVGVSLTVAIQAFKFGGWIAACAIISAIVVVLTSLGSIQNVYRLGEEGANPMARSAIEGGADQDRSEKCSGRNADERRDRQERAN